MLSKWRFQAFFLPALFWCSGGWRLCWSLVGPAVGSEIVYEGRQQVNDQLTIRYFLTERIENERRIFSLFTAKNEEYQDLRWERSFGMEQGPLATAWLRSIAKKYHLTLHTKMGPDPQDPQEEAQAGVQWKRSPKAPVIWRAEQVWNSEWEAEYGRWASTTLTPQLMVDLQQPTDCADVAYLLRWAFARVHKLPMAVHLAGSKQIFTNESILPAWEKLPVNDQDWRQDQRLRAAITYLLRNTYTHTLMQDSYPVALNVQALTPGTYHLELHGESGHTMLVDSVNRPDQLPITLLYSTVPVRIRALIPTFYMNQTAPVLYQSGFYKLRWALQTADTIQLLAAKLIPGHSEEQFQLGNQNDPTNRTPHFLQVFQKINPQFRFQLMLEKSYQELQERLQERITIVEEGYHYCLDHDCRPGSQGHEDWSTPSRDQRLHELHSTMNLAGSFLRQSDPDAFQAWSAGAAANARAPRWPIEGENYTLAEVLVALIYQLMGSDPRLPIAERWGVSVEGNFATLQKQLTSTLAQRKTMVAQAQVCRLQHCPAPSEMFRQLNTMPLDFALGLRWVGAQALCRWQSAAQCQNLREKLANFVIDQVTAEQWLASVPRWIADPNAPLNTRWGFPGQLLQDENWALGRFPAFFTDDRQFFALGPQLYQTVQMVSIPRGEGESLGALNPSNNQYFTYHATAEHLSLRFYQLPSQLLGAVDIAEPTGQGQRVRIFWSAVAEGPATVAVFTPRNFYQIATTGEILHQLPLTGFWPALKDPHLLFIRTEQGIFVCDALQNAQVWMPVRLPLASDEMEQFVIVARTQQGMVLRNEQERLLYLEAAGVVLDWPLIPQQQVYFSPAGEYVARENAAKTAVEVYQRQQGAPKYHLQKLLPGIIITGQALFLEILHDMQLQIYSLAQQEYFAPPCNWPASAHLLVANRLYACSSGGKTELHRADGQLLAVSDLGGQWRVASQTANSIFLTNMAVEEGSWALNTQIFALLNDELVGPILQSSQELNPRDHSFSTILLSETSDQLAPVRLGPGVQTNYGVQHPLPRVPSLLLEQVVKFPLPQAVLFLPAFGE